MRKLLSIFITTVLISCSNNNNETKEEENVDGGPCSYHEDYFPLKVIEIDSSTSDNCELTLVKILEEDTIYYSHYNPNILAASEIEEKEIHVGDTITFVEMNIETGSCNPFIQTVSLESYNYKLTQ